MTRSLEYYKARVDKSLIRILHEYEKPLLSVNKWGSDVLTRLTPFVTAGKSVRGSLVLLSYELFKNTSPQAAVDVAGALELIHAGLLIHDDIMDQDQMRRGAKSLYAQYQELFSDKRTGESLALCVGDVSFFMALSVISSLGFPLKITRAVMNKISSELTLVGVAQMQDVALPNQKEKATKDTILTLYRYKTARYTCSLPLALGAILAGQNEDVVSALEIYGEHVGILFQIIDDQLNLFGDTEVTGKPVGSDIREEKVTLFSYYAKKLHHPPMSRDIMDMVEKDKRKIIKKIHAFREQLPIEAEKKLILRDVETALLQRSK